VCFLEVMKSSVSWLSYNGKNGGMREKENTEVGAVQQAGRRAVGILCSEYKQILCNKPFTFLVQATEISWPLQHVPIFFV